MNGLVSSLLAGGGTLLAILILAYLLVVRGGGGRWAIGLAFAAGSVLGIAGILWNVVEIGTRAVGEVLGAVLNAVSSSVGVIEFVALIVGAR